MYAAAVSCVEAMSCGNIFTACTTTVAKSPTTYKRMRNASAVGVQYSSLTNYGCKYIYSLLLFCGSACETVGWFSQCQTVLANVVRYMLSPSVCRLSSVCRL